MIFKIRTKISVLIFNLFPLSFLAFSSLASNSIVILSEPHVSWGPFFSEFFKFGPLNLFRNRSLRLIENKILFWCVNKKFCRIIFNQILNWPNVQLRTDSTVTNFIIFFYRSFMTYFSLKISQNYSELFLKNCLSYIISF